MLSSDIAISVRGLSKAYTIAHNQEQHNTLAEMLLARLKNPFNRVKRETFWALSDISFDIKKGDVVGIIGRNGAGKSTLLKILSRITGPTKGEIDIFGRVGSLLEVGTGFHYELTGRENIYLSGAILGMKKAEIRKQFDAIVEFAEVQKFLDTPVKRYSSGMYVRLAFSVAAHLNPEILIVDEVLAVGDADFQKKCLIKMKDMSTSGRTVLFVSHNIGVIRALCERGLVLSNGSLIFDGEADYAADHYMSIMAKTSRQTITDRTDRAGRGSIRFIGVEAKGLGSDNISPLIVGQGAELVFSINQWASGLTCHVIIYDHRGLPVAHCTTINPSPDDQFENYGEDACKIVWTTDELLLMPGSYSVNAELFRDGALEDRVERLLCFDVQPGMVRGRVCSQASKYGGLAVPHRWSVRALEPKSAVQLIAGGHAR
jgi:lipopolysaccharide transport system ATP-binding protein